MIESLSSRLSTQRRHRAAPLLKEREQYLAHLLQIGWSAHRVLEVATYLVHIVRMMELVSLRCVETAEIEQAGLRWANDEGAERVGKRPETSPVHFTKFARQWLRFLGVLNLPGRPTGCFDVQVAEFKDALEVRRLASTTINTYVTRTENFLRWLSARCSDLSLVSIYDVDDFLASKRDARVHLLTISGHCIALRAFFRFAEEQGWSPPGIWRGIVGPRIPMYTEPPAGPSWVDVRRLIRSTQGKTSGDLRTRALLLLCAIYGLRVSEVARLRLEDFNWRSETFSVLRSKRGGVQQFPIQYEVGEAILDYLRYGRPRCACRHLFLTAQLPYRPLSKGAICSVVQRQFNRLGIQSKHRGPHSLRHACATRLLTKGSSLKEIADFLGHRSTQCVAIYARYDRRSLRKVAAFSLAEIL